MIPDLDEVLGGLRVVALPLRTRFRGITAREVALVEGPEGWAEFSPFVEYPDAEAATWLAAAYDFGWSPAPAAQRDSVPVNATLPVVDAEAVPALLDRFAGATTVKIKVADADEGPEAEERRIAAARAWLGEEGRIRLDANGAWTLVEAEERLLRYRDYGLEYAEQPCRTVPELAALRARLAGSGILVAADESVRRAEDPLAVARAGAADLLVIKAAPLGGIRRALALVAEAELPVVVSSALDSSVGLAMGAHLAAALPPSTPAGDARAAGLGTAALLAADVTRSPLIPVGGRIPVERTRVDAALLAEHAAPEDRTAWWRARLARCHALLLEHGGA